MYNLTRMMNFQMFGMATHLVVIALMIIFLGFERTAYLYGCYNLVLQVIGAFFAIKVHTELTKEDIKL